MMIIGPNDTLIPFIAIEIGLWQFHFSRSVLAILILLTLFFFFGIKFEVKNIKSVLIRTIFVTLSMIVYFGSLGFVPIAVTGAGMFTAPIFVIVFTSLFFKDPIVNLIFTRDLAFSF